MPTARRLGDRDDRRNLDGRNHRSRHEADLSTWSQAKFDRYLSGVGWLILLGIRPMLASVDTLTAILIGVGGVLYSIGIAFHLWRTLPFHSAIWHSFVLVAASCHYAAILHGVVLART